MCSQYPKMSRKSVLMRWSVGVAALLISALFVARIDAQSIRDDSSLRLVPESASFYVSSLNHKEMLDRVIESRAFSELVNAPMTQMLMGAFEQGFIEEGAGTPDEMWAQLEDAVGEEQLKDLIAFASDVASHEMFIYGDEGFADILEMMRAYADALPADVGDLEAYSEEQQLEMLVEFAQRFAEQDLDRIRVPDTVIGFKVEDPERAIKHVELLHAFATLGMLSGEVPTPIRRAYSKKKVGDTEFLRFQLRGSMLPLEDLEIDFDSLSADQADVVDTYLAHVEQMSVTIGIGVYQDYLLISIGDTLEHVSQLGEQPLLIDREEFAGLREHANEEFVGVYYVSDRLMKALFTASLEEMLPSFVDGVMLGISTELPIDPRLADEMREDAIKLGAQFDSLVPDPGAVMGFSYLSDSGIEGYRYAWMVSPLSDGSRPLTILDHVGDDPFFFAAGRAAYQPERYADMRDWVARVDWYMEEFAKPAMGAEYAGYEAVRQIALPYLTRFDKTTSELLLPSLADGQHAFVMDLANESNQWGPLMPRSSVPLPVPEFALVLGLSDKDRFLQAMGEYDRLTRDLQRDIVLNFAPDFPEELDLKEADSAELTSGVAYYYPIDELETLGLDGAFRPNMAVSDDFAVFSMSLGHSERLLEGSGFPSDSGPFEQRDQPLASAVGLNFVSLVDAMEAWFKYSEEQGGFGELAMEEAGLPFEADMLLESIDTYLAVARCFRGVQSVTSVGDGKTVTRFRIQFEDIPW